MIAGIDPFSWNRPILRGTIDWRMNVECPVKGVDITSANIASTIRTDLYRQGIPNGRFDVPIAATALANNLALVTHNVPRFRG